MPITLVDVTSGRLRHLLDYLDAVATYLATPPELASIFPRDFTFDFSRIRVSVQLSEERSRAPNARQRERERAVGMWMDDDLQALRRYARRSAEEYEEQAQRAVVQDWEQVRGDLSHPKLQRAIILGDPGFGKSWLLRYEGRKLALAERARLVRSAVGTAEVIVPIFAPLGRLAEQEGPLLHRLRAVLDEQEDFKPSVADLWDIFAEKAEQGRALLLLDGWDEVGQGRKSLKEALETFVRMHPQCRLYLTSRIVGYEPLYLGPQSKELELVSFSPDQIETFVQLFFSMPTRQNGPSSAPTPQTKKGADLWQELQQHPYIMGLACIPLMLALLCRLYWEGASLPERRVEVYHRCLWGLLWYWRKKPGGNGTLEGDPVADMVDVTQEFSLLEPLAFSLLQVAPQADAWDLDTLITQVQQLPGGPCTKEQARSLITKWQRHGVFVSEGRWDGADAPVRLRFLHRTFQEYLAASALAKMRDWPATVTGWLQGFWEARASVLELLAGVLDDADATLLIELLLAHDAPKVLTREWHSGRFRRLARRLGGWASRGRQTPFPRRWRGKDPFGNVLLLAARCTAETTVIPPAWAEEILRRARQRLREGYPRADNVINALAFMEWRWEEANHFLNTMISKLLNTSCSYSVRSAGWMAHRDKTWEEDLRLYIDLLYLLYSDSLEFLLMTDGLVAWRWRWWDDKREAVPCLCRILIDARTPSHFRKAVADALGQLGYREAVPYLCQHLVDNYTDAHDYGMTAAEVLGRLNDRQVVADLCQILVNVRTSGTIRMIVAWVLGHLGDRRAVSNLCQILTDPRDDTYDYSWAAAEALGRLGDRQAVPYLCQVLTAPHDDNNNSIHFGTGLSPDSDLGIILGPLLAMLRWLGEGKTVPYLCKILADVRVSFARTAAAWMLGLLGNRQAVPYLRETLADPRVNWVARQAAAWALQQLGGVHSPLVRAVVVKALGQLGDRQAIPYLCEILVDPHAHRDVRAIAEKVLWRLGSGQAVLTSCQPVVDTAVGIHKTAALMLDQLGFGQTVPYLRKCLGHKPIYDEDGFRRNPEPLEALALKALEALDRRLRTEKEGLGV